jgi:hypothetical protein
MLEIKYRYEFHSSYPQLINQFQTIHNLHFHTQPFINLTLHKSDTSYPKFRQKQHGHQLKQAIHFHSKNEQRCVRQLVNLLKGHENGKGVINCNQTQKKKKIKKKK